MIKKYSGTSKKINEKNLPDFVRIDQETQEYKIEIDFEKSLNSIGTFLIFDIETTGLPKIQGAKPEDLSNWPRIVQISWLLLDSEFKEVNSSTHYLQQESSIPKEAVRIHKITDEIIKEKGEDPKLVLENLFRDLKRTKYIITHNIAFDTPILESEFFRYGYKNPFRGIKKLCTMKTGTKYCEIPRPYGRGYKYPKLEELVQHCFFSKYAKIELGQTHDAEVDTMLTAKCFIKLIEQGYFENIQFKTAP